MSPNVDLSALILRLASALLVSSALWTGSLDSAAIVVLSYLFWSVLGDALLRPRIGWIAPIGLAILDASLAGYVLYEHLLAPSPQARHELTASSLVVVFLLLNQVAMRLDTALVLVFGAAVALAWSAMLVVLAFRHTGSQHGPLVDIIPLQDLLLLLCFCLAIGAAALSARRFRHVRVHAYRLEERRANLSRFFSPTVIGDLQDATSVLDLERREAAIMFIDLRDFTAYAENAPASEMASVLAQYRRIIAGAVLSFNGTVDKFIGDGVMVVFGQPKASPDDPERALSCALFVAQELEVWRNEAFARGQPSFHAGIGVHCGVVVGGVLESGFHDEFTVIGDVVNVAQRLEALAKILGSPLVVSENLLKRAPAQAAKIQWVRKRDVSLTGRSGSLDIAFIRRNSSATGQVDGAEHSASSKSSFQSRLASTGLGR